MAHRQSVRPVELYAVPQAVGVRAEPERAGRHYEPAGVVEHLEAVVPRVGDDDAAVVVDGDVVRALQGAVLQEQARRRGPAHREQGGPVVGEYVDATADLVGDVHAAVGAHVDAGRRQELLRIVDLPPLLVAGGEFEDGPDVERRDVHGAVDGRHGKAARGHGCAVRIGDVELRLVRAACIKPLDAVVGVVRDEYVPAGGDVRPRGEPELAVAGAAQAERPVVDVRAVGGPPDELDAVVAAVDGDDAAARLDGDSEQGPKLERAVVHPADRRVERAVGVERKHAVAAAVGHVHLAAAVSEHGLGRVEQVVAAELPHYPAGAVHLVDGVGNGGADKNCPGRVVDVDVHRKAAHGPAGGRRVHRHRDRRQVGAVGGERLDAVVVRVGDVYRAVGRDCNGQGESELSGAVARLASQRAGDTTGLAERPIEHRKAGRLVQEHYLVERRDGGDYRAAPWR